jgi:hypothetical protein
MTYLYRSKFTEQGGGAGGGGGGGGGGGMPGDVMEHGN